MDYAQLFAGVPVEPKRYVATFQGNDPQNDYEPATVTVEVSDWVYEGKLVQQAGDVANDWAYERFDKGYFKLIDLQEIKS